ncbi:vesicle-associated membrane protein 7B-like [Pocillopora verrucosa]|uniref:vesicle-associated membrane protein 7B-like n=1 Tax=Pocillopora verrucosa TaxID=203993 RepID=UPI002797BD66|nr:vesicle-associated membrane protein 7B-like [Pocillopora verrucosa]
MSIIYSLIARGTTVLVDYTESSGNFQQITGSILQKIPLHDDTKCTYVSGSYHFHVIVDDGLVYLCMADEDFGKRQPYAFLEEIKRRFVNSSLKQRAISAHAYEFRRDFGQVLASQMSLYSDPGYDESDQIAKVQKEVNEVKDVMTQNIEKVLERGEKIDVLVGKTEELDHSSQVFHRQAKRLRREMWWKNKKICLILVFVVAIIIAVIVLAILGVEGKL